MVRGRFGMALRGGEPRPVADEEAEVLLVEPASRLETGDVVDERTRRVLERL
ncbi:MAG TPA: hypothetical protein VNK43_11680 [Gemmatimonadales bacterium]|nr:hypothetical protein [Gemmatimonadales bacterium]